MQAFHNDPKIKQKYVDRVLEHMRLDHLVKGVGWESNGEVKGCAIGCTLEKYEHKAYEYELGIPIWLAYLEDKLFEGMSWQDAKDWPYKFLDAINVGADLEQIKIPCLIIVCESVLENVEGDKHAKQRKAIENVITELKRKVLDKDKLKDAANAAYAAAYATNAAGYATNAAGYAANAVYAENAAHAAGYAAHAAVYAAVYAANAVYAAYAAANAGYAARQNKYKYFADELLKLIRDCKPVPGKERKEQ